MSDQTTAVETIIKQAIKGEEDSHDLYTAALGRVRSSQAKTMLEQMARDELGHKAKLEALLQRGLTWSIARGAFDKVIDLRVGDHLVVNPLDEGADIQAVLTFAIHREKGSHELYSTMAGVACDETTRNLFEFLANEELTHKRRLESLFEDTVYQHF